jgi:BirA family biotin operon repressor/biotin-[acetyl-CoA-carboxylase] ligase
LIRPRFAPPLARFVTIAAAVAAVRAIRDVAALDVALKWPNDLVARRDTSAGVPGAPAWLKLGGILAESRVRGDAIEAVVVGVGLNIDLAPDELPAGVALIATSLGALTGRSVSREDLLVALLARFAETLDALERGATAALVAAFRERTILLGESVTIDGGEGALTGVVRGIDDAGALLVERGDGTIVAVVAGEASLRPRGDAEAGTDAH